MTLPTNPEGAKLVATLRDACEKAAYALDVRANTTPGAWVAEESLDTPGWFDVWTMDGTGQRRIVIARHMTGPTAALICFASTGLAGMADCLTRLADALTAPPPVGGASVEDVARLARLDDLQTALARIGRDGLGSFRRHFADAHQATQLAVDLAALIRSERV